MWNSKPKFKDTMQYTVLNIEKLENLFSQMKAEIKIKKEETEGNPFSTLQFLIKACGVDTYRRHAYAVIFLLIQIGEGMKHVRDVKYPLESRGENQLTEPQSQLSSSPVGEEKELHVFTTKSIAHRMKEVLAKEILTQEKEFKLNDEEKEQIANLAASVEAITKEPEIMERQKEIGEKIEEFFKKIEEKGFSTQGIKEFRASIDGAFRLIADSLPARRRPVTSALTSASGETKGRCSVFFELHGKFFAKVRDTMVHHIAYVLFLNTQQQSSLPLKELIGQEVFQNQMRECTDSVDSLLNKLSTTKQACLALVAGEQKDFVIHRPINPPPGTDIIISSFSSMVPYMVHFKLEETDKIVQEIKLLKEQRQSVESEEIEREKKMEVLKFAFLNNLITISNLTKNRPDYVALHFPGRRGVFAALRLASNNLQHDFSFDRDIIFEHCLTSFSGHWKLKLSQACHSMMLFEGIKLKALSVMYPPPLLPADDSASLSSSSSSSSPAVSNFPLLSSVGWASSRLPSSHSLPSPSSASFNVTQLLPSLQPWAEGMSMFFHRGDSLLPVNKSEQALRDKPNGSKTKKK